MKKRITTEQILSEARRIANSKNFKGSFSWYRRFKLRHPEITNLVKQYQY
jgi:predicted ATP-binding protein involved in virulence